MFNASFGPTELTLVAAVLGLLGTLRLLVSIQQAAEDPQRWCNRCGDVATLLDEHTERPRFGGLTVVERHRCLHCGHEQLRVYGMPDALDGA